SVGLSGRGMPGGGIIPARSFLITFSHVCAPFGISMRSACSSVSPPVRALSLWQETQYFFNTSDCAACPALPYSAWCCWAVVGVKVSADKPTAARKNGSLRNRLRPPSSTGPDCPSILRGCAPHQRFWFQEDAMHRPPLP